LLYFTIAFVAEKTGFNNCIISGAIDTKNNPFGGLTIKYIKDGINNGTITATDPGNGQTTINAYIAMYKAAGSYFHLINFSLMSFITNTFAAPATDPTTA
jgi:hypothetical protein